MNKTEIKERLDDLGIDYTSSASKTELELLLPTKNPTDFDPFASDEIWSSKKESSKSINVVAPTLKKFMKMVKIKFDWSKAIAVPTQNSLDENVDVKYTLEIGDKATFKKVEQADGSKVKEFTDRVIMVISSTKVNDMLANGQLSTDDLFSLQVSSLELMDKRTGKFVPRFFLNAPRPNGLEREQDVRDEDISTRTITVKRKRKAMFQLN